MIRINKIQLMPTKKQRKLIKEMMVLSSCVYNMANYEQRQRFITGDKILSYFSLQKEIQKKDDYQLLGRSYALPILKKYSENISCIFALIKSKKVDKFRLPKYYKNRKTNTTIPSYLVMDGMQVKFSDIDVRIPLSHKMRKKYNLKDFWIKYNGILRYQGKTCRSEIHYEEGHYYFYQSVEIPDVDKLPIEKSMGIDLGIKRLISYYTSNEKSLTIGNQRWFKQWMHYGDLIAKEKSYLATINKKSSNKLKRLFRKRTKYQKQLYDNVVSKLFKHIKKHNIQQIFIGDVKHIRESGSKGKLVNTMINNYWSYDKLYHKIESKAEELGITFNRITEEYTSRTCPICGCNHKGNLKDRKFLCKDCSFFSDRDLVGARNILTKGMYGSLQNIHRCEVTPLGVLI